MTVHRFFVPPGQIATTKVRILGDDAHQIRRVLRLGPGAEIEAFDGSGRQFQSRLIKIGPDEVTAEIHADTSPETESPYPLLLLQSLLKGEKLDWVVEKAAELGATRILLFPARRSVIQVREERSERKLQRWRRIAKEAAEQCGRVKLPEVALMESLEAALKEAGDVALFMADEATARGRSEGAPKPEPGPVGAIIGPEGGWTDDERGVALQHGARTLTLGPRILRAETAALVALARLSPQ
jgi:16S rRNA (uracil1498-N3)-methyltransferase